MKMKKRKNYIKVLLPRIILAWVLSAILSLFVIETIYERCSEEFIKQNKEVAEAYYKYCTKTDGDVWLWGTPRIRIIVNALAENNQFKVDSYDSLAKVDNIRYACIYDADKDLVLMDSRQEMNLNMGLILKNDDNSTQNMSFFFCDSDRIKETEPFKSIIDEKEKRTTSLRAIYGKVSYTINDIEVEEFWYNEKDGTFLPIKGTVYKTTYENLNSTFKKPYELVDKITKESVSFDLSSYFETIKEDYTVWKYTDGNKPRANLSGTTDIQYEYINRFLTENSKLNKWEYSSSSKGGGAFSNRPMYFISVQKLPEEFGNKEIRYICVKDSVLGSYYPIWTLIAGIIFTVFSVIAVLISVFTYQKLLYFYRNEDYRIALINCLVHDLKTPLTVMSGFAENLKENIQTESREEYADGILQNTGYINNIIEDVIELSHSSQADGKVKKEQADLIDLFKESEECFKTIIEEKNIKTDYQGSYIRRMDIKAMKRVCDNLLGNAVKYTKNGGKIRIYVVDRPFCHYFAIENSPIAQITGNPKKLWEPFMKDDESRSDVSGNGLGLAISKKILEKNRLKAKIMVKEKSFIVRIK